MSSGSSSHSGSGNKPLRIHTLRSKRLCENILVPTLKRAVHQLMSDPKRAAKVHSHLDTQRGVDLLSRLLNESAAEKAKEAKSSSGKNLHRVIYH